MQVTATDAVGNIGTDATTDELTIDTAAPVVTVDSLLTNDTTPGLTGTVDDAAATIQSHGGGHHVPGDQPGQRHVDTGRQHDYSGADRGVYDVQVTATDAVGNIGTDGTTDELTIDTRPRWSRSPCWRPMIRLLP